MLNQGKLYLSKTRFNLNDAAFPQQLNFIHDPIRLKALFCTRRAAKSYTAGLYLISTALQYPNSNCLFIALTRQSAHGIVWKDILRELDLKYGLKARFNETNLTMTLSNGSVIWVTGADTDEQEMNKLLGKKYKLVVIDEASMFTINMRQLVYGILKPATADQRGAICLLGTASNVARGLFYDITTGSEPGWSLHTWTAHDNPHVAQQWQEELDDIDKNRPLFKQTTLYRQWYLNEWCQDENALVYKFTRSRNSVIHLPAIEGLWSFVLGIDLGHSPDPSAFVVSAFSHNHPVLYVVHAEAHLRFDITDVANKIKELETRFKFDVKVVDNANKQAVEELNNRHNCSLIPADKAGKQDFINLLNDELIQKKIMFLPQTEELKKELETLVWVTESDGKLKLTGTKQRIEHPALPNHLCDALLYNWRYTYTYLLDTPKAKDWTDFQNQNDWEPKHIEKIAQEIQSKNDPNHWNTTFQPDENLFDDYDGGI